MRLITLRPTLILNKEGARRNSIFTPSLLSGQVVLLWGSESRKSHPVSFTQPLLSFLIQPVTWLRKGRKRKVTPTNFCSMADCTFRVCNATCGPPFQTAIGAEKLEAPSHPCIFCLRDNGWSFHVFRCRRRA